MNFDFAVVHWGARQHYAVARVLHSAGMLRVLYTDAHAGSPISGSLLRYVPMAAWLPAAERLRSRVISDEIPRAKIRSMEWLTFQQAIFNVFSRDSTRYARYAYEHRVGSHGLAARLAERDFEGANGLYVHACAATLAVQEAKRRGMFVVLEAISMPFLRYLESEEYLRFGNVPPHSQNEIEDNIDFFREETLRADLLLAASTHVQDGLERLGVDARKIAVVPYGLSSDWFVDVPAPRRGRLLFVGNVGYLKGIPYFAEAVRELRRRGCECEARVVGPYDKSLVKRPEFSGLEYLGQVSRGKMRDEYRQADVFVFPTVSDGFGMVILEAMAMSVPVVCTTNCADVVTDGVSGFVVPPRDSRALVARLELLLRDRGRRGQMARAAREEARTYDMNAYRLRLLEAFDQARHEEK